MRSEFFNKMEQSRIDYFKLIKYWQNPNPFDDRVEEELKKTDLPVVEEVALKPLLQVQRVYDHDDEDDEEECDKEENNDDDTVMITLGSIRIRNFLSRCYERVVKAFNYWFEIELPLKLSEPRFY